ncbi:SprB repeat-containing protein, partial [bacterium]|nr:SprB repeat-containing protein [bacterium]
PYDDWSLGLSANQGGDNWYTINYSFYLTGSFILIIENGNTVNSNAGNVIAGDDLRIEREGSSIKYYKNNTLLHTTSTTPTIDLHADITMNNAGGTMNSVVMNNPSAPQITQVVTHVNSGLADGAIDISVTGGVTPYTYLWSTGATTQDISGLTPGDYSLTVTDNASNTSASTITVSNIITWQILDGITVGTSQELIKTASTSYSNSGAFSTDKIFSGEDGSIQATIVNPSDDWSLGLSDTEGGSNWYSIDYSFYLSGTFILIIENGNTVNSNAGNVVAGDDLRIERDGSIIKYYHNEVVLRTVNTNAALDLHADITMNNTGGTMNHIVMTNPSSPQITSSIISPVCGNTDGAINISVTGGEMPYTYLWNTGATTEDISGLAPGDYTITVTDNASNVETSTITLTNNITWSALTGIIVGASGELIKTGTTSFTNSGAFSSNKIPAGEDGFIEAIVDNPTDGWSLGLSDTQGADNWYTIDYSFFIDQTYIYIVENGVTVLNNGTTVSTGDKLKISRNGNTISYYKNSTLLYSSSITSTTDLHADITINQTGSTMSDISMSCPYLPMTLSSVITHTTCESSVGNIDLSITGGKAPFIYSWSNGLTTEDIDSLALGEYTVTVTDATGETATSTIEINSAVEWTNIQEGYACDASYTKPDVWLKFYGGAGLEYTRELVKTSDGGSIFTARITDGTDIPGHIGGHDGWVVKLDKDGNVEWTRVLGGSQAEYFHSIKEDADGNYILGGGTSSADTLNADGDIPSNQGGSDLWAVKLDPSGNTLWSKTYGSSLAESCDFVSVTSDGGYLLGGSTWSPDGSIFPDSIGSSGRNDFWVVKLDVNGNMEWNKVLGGIGYEGVGNVLEHQDGTYYIVGVTYATGGSDFAGIPQKGASDLGIVRLSSTGDLLWAGVYGGSGADGFLHRGVEAADGGIVIGGRSKSADMDVPSNQGGYDYWALKIDTTGNLLWSKTYGGSADDYFTEISATADNGFLLTGWTESNDGDIHGSHGGSEIWSVKIDSIGDTLWTQAYGGLGDDEGYGIIETAPGTFLLLGIYDFPGTNPQVCLKKMSTLSCNGEESTAMVSPTDANISIGVSKNKLLAGVAGKIEYTITELGKNQQIGLIFDESDPSTLLLEYGYEITPTSINLREQVNTVSQIASYVVGDKLQIARVGDQINYYHNETLVRTVTTDSSKILLAKTILSEGITISLVADYDNNCIEDINVSSLVTPETYDGLGSLYLSVTGGVPPYNYYWSDTTLTTKDRDSLNAGIYNVIVVDTRMDSSEHNLPVYFDFGWNNVQGLSIVDNQIYKDGEEGWGTGTATSNHIITGDVIIQTVIDELEKEWTFGLRNYTNNRIIDYTGLDFGFYIKDNNELYVSNGTQLTLVGQVSLNDILGITKTGNNIVLAHNGITVVTFNSVAGRVYNMDISYFSSRQIGKGFVFVLIGPTYVITGIDAEITHSNCFQEIRGAIDITVLQNGNDPLEYNWVSTNGFTSQDEDISSLRPGEYTVTVNVLNYNNIPSGIVGLIYVKTFIVGNKVFWINEDKTVSNENDLSRSDFQAGVEAGANSYQILPADVSGRASFTLEKDYEDYFDNTLVSGDIKNPAGIPVFVFGLSEVGQIPSAMINYGIEIFQAKEEFSGPGGGANYFLRPPTYRLVQNGVPILLPVSPNNTPSEIRGACNIGDVLSISRDGQMISFFINNIIIGTPIDVNVKYGDNINSKDLKVDASIFVSETDQNYQYISAPQIHNASTSFPCNPTPKVMYAKPSKKLDGSFYVADQGQLFVKYNEE